MEFVEFYKMSGTGNDFIVFDMFAEATQKKLQKINRTDLTKSICQRGISIGADGVVFIEKTPQYDFAWDFYNSDGSMAEMCGNASRCVARLAFDLGYTTKKTKFKTIAGVVEAELNADKTVSIQMPAQISLGKKTTIKVDNHSVNGHILNTGVPHFVIESKKDFNLSLGLAKKIRNHKKFASKGTNVTLYKKINESEIKSVTYERGVEGFTLSCGTGAVAAGLVFQGAKNISEVRVNVPGGALYISQNKKTNRPVLRGAAELIYKGEFNMESIV